jgi:hypothetical protein
VDIDLSGNSGVKANKLALLIDIRQLFLQVQQSHVAIGTPSTVKTTGPFFK